MNTKFTKRKKAIDAEELSPLNKRRTLGLGEDKSASTTHRSHFDSSEIVKTRKFFNVNTTRTHVVSTFNSLEEDQWNAVLQRRAISDGSPVQEVARILADVLDEYELGNEQVAGETSDSPLSDSSSTTRKIDDTVAQMLAMLQSSEQTAINLAQGEWTQERAAGAYRRWMENKSPRPKVTSEVLLAFQSMTLDGFFVPPSMISAKTRVVLMMDMPSGKQVEDIFDSLHLIAAESSMGETRSDLSLSFITPKLVLSALELEILREQLHDWGVFQHLQLDPAQIDASFEDGTIGVGFVIPFVLQNHGGVVNRVSVQAAERFLNRDESLRRVCVQHLNWLVTSARDSIVLPIGEAASRMVSILQLNITLDSEKLFFGMALRRKNLLSKKSGKSNQYLTKTSPIDSSNLFVDDSIRENISIYNSERDRFGVFYHPGPDS